ncbi:hypothetical protein VMCG_04594 [Cytospora schulzeri]|uniref:Uncharacterized protein n=1 Tax=Cytospora schulzeri TaxID=448051 RepID=A0A423WSA1_9PEZI|nr:hypothetical protein VMCG_04594 [Valsa malicola]
MPLLLARGCLVHEPGLDKGISGDGVDEREPPRSELLAAIPPRRDVVRGGADALVRGEEVLHVVLGLVRRGDGGAARDEGGPQLDRGVRDDPGGFRTQGGIGPEGRRLRLCRRRLVVPCCLLLPLLLLLLQPLQLLDGVEQAHLARLVDVPQHVPEELQVPARHAAPPARAVGADDARGRLGVLGGELQPQGHGRLVRRQGEDVHVRVLPGRDEAPVAVDRVDGLDLVGELLGHG